MVNKLNKDARLSRPGTEKQCKNVKMMKVSELNELLGEVIATISVILYFASVPK